MIDQHGKLKFTFVSYTSHSYLQHNWLNTKYYHERKTDDKMRFQLKTYAQFFRKEHLMFRGLPQASFIAVFNWEKAILITKRGKHSALSLCMQKAKDDL